MQFRGTDVACAAKEGGRGARVGDAGAKHRPGMRRLALGAADGIDRPYGHRATGREHDRNSRHRAPGKQLRSGVRRSLDAREPRARGLHGRGRHRVPRQRHIRSNNRHAAGGGLRLRGSLGHRQLRYHHREHRPHSDGAARRSPRLRHGHGAGGLLTPADCLHNALWPGAGHLPGQQRERDAG
jgi:hypothetical protein